MTSAFVLIARRTLTLAWRTGGGTMTAILFFLSVVVVFPFGVGPDLALLARIGPAILWVAALLATLLGLDRLFQDDRDDGSLDLFALSDLPLELTFLAKASGHWLATGLPLTIATPFFGLFLNIEAPVLAWLTLTLLIGTPTLTLIGAIGAALMTVLRRGGMLVAVLILPLTLPVLIFGVSAATAATTSASAVPPLLIEIALFLIALVVAPVAGAQALKSSLD